MSDMTDLSFTYDWQAQPQTSLFSWLLPTILAGHRDPMVEQLSELSDHFAKTELSIRINGVEVSARAFIEGLERNYDRAVADKAAELLAERINDLTDGLSVDLDALRRQLTRAVRVRFADAGTPLPDDRDDW